MIKTCYKYLYMSINACFSELSIHQRILNLTNLIKIVFFEQPIRMISEGPCDWSTDTALIVFGSNKHKKPFWRAKLVSPKLIRMLIYTAIKMYLILVFIYKKNRYGS